MIDILAAVAGLGAAAGVGPGDSADTACARHADAFDGRQLVQSLLQLPTAPTVAALVATLTPVPVDLALSGRGFVVRTAAGRLGVTVGYGRVVEPAGRQYALTQSDPSRFTDAWAAPTVVYTA